MKSALNPHKILNHIEDIEKIILDNKVPPLALEIDLSNICNHNCIWCMFGKFRNKSPVILDKEIIFKLLEDFNKFRNGIKAITYVGGGEPLLHPDLQEILYKTKEYDFEIGIITNGELLSKYSKVIKETCEFVRISLDAGTSKTFKYLHGIKGNSFSVIIKSIKKLCDNKGKLVVGVAFLVHPENFYEIPDLVSLLIALNVDYLQIRPVYLKNLTFSNKMLKELDIILQEAENRVKGTNLNLITFRNRFIEFNGEDLKPSECLAHNIIGVIGADANIYLCCQLRGKKRFNFGSLKEQSFKEIWYSQKRQEIINKIDINRCPPCRYKKYNEIMNYLKTERRHKYFL